MRPPNVSTAFERKDYYRVLQVDPAAHAEVIAAAYRTLLRVLGKHPDLGGTEQEAKLIIEAYSTLSDPERRRAYDQWLRAHSSALVRVVTGAGRKPVPLLERLTAAVRAALPEYRVAANAPFARAFDVVLESPASSSARVYVKTYSLVTRANWPTIFVLCRALAVARQGMMPSTDLIFVTAGRIEESDAFVAAATKHAAPWAWNRFLVGVYALSPPLVHLDGAIFMPRAFHRLKRALAARGAALA